MAAGDVKLLGNYYSPFVLRAKVAFNIKAVKYDYIEENLMSKSERLVKANPIHQKIPVLVHDEHNICESLIIVEYIDEVWSTGPSLLPTHPPDRAAARFWAAYIDHKSGPSILPHDPHDPHDRATARFWAAYIYDKLFPAFRELRTARGEEEIVVVVNKMVEGFLLLEDAFVKSSKGKPFFGGETIGYLDIAFGCGLPWFNVVERMTNIKLLDETKMPNLVVWANRFNQHPAVKDILPEIWKLMEFYKMLTHKEEDVVAAN